MERRKFLKSSAIAVAGTGLIAAGCDSPKTTSKNAKFPAKKRADIKSEDFRKTAIKHFLPGKKNCCEAMLITGTNEIGVSDCTLEASALSLGGGVGLQGKTCGILTGSAMAISVAATQRHQKNRKKRAKLANQQTAKLIKAFENKYRTTDCKKLCGLDLTKPAERKKLKGKTGVKATVCAPMVEFTSRQLATALNEIKNS